MKLKDIAEEIKEYLNYFENNSEINTYLKNCKRHKYYGAYSWAGKKYVYIRYISYQNNWNLTKIEALKYLEQLKAGKVGKHYEV